MATTPRRRTTPVTAKQTSTLLYIGEHLVDLDRDKLTNVEAMRIEAAIGGPPVLAWGFMRTMAQLTAMLWITRLRTEPELELSDVTFTLSELRDPDTDPATTATVRRSDPHAQS